MPVLPLWYPRDFIAYSDRLQNVHCVADYLGLDRVQVVG
jgi:hypothetical protein